MTDRRKELEDKLLGLQSQQDQIDADEDRVANLVLDVIEAKINVLKNVPVGEYERYKQEMAQAEEDGKDNYAQAEEHKLRRAALQAQIDQVEAELKDLEGDK